MSKKPFLRLSVHGLVDFWHRKGSIDNRIYNAETMAEGTRLHSLYQQSRPFGYRSEVHFGHVFDRPLGTVELSGRADGLIEGEGIPEIEEIKSFSGDLREFHETQKEWHFAQAECYALMYLLEHPEQEKIKVRLAYLSQGRKETMKRSKTYKKEELVQKVVGYLDKYLSLYAREEDRKSSRDASLLTLEFPFSNPRPGQKEMMEEVHNDLEEGAIGFVEAPTGIGKSLAAIYPALKGLGEGECSKVFYLTAKNTGREAAEKAFRQLKEKGLRARLSSIAGKEKSCPFPEAGCNPDQCPFARDYYTKLPQAVSELLESEEDFTYSFVMEEARRREMCPFELELDLSLYSDLVVMDYNYLFDPLVKLERYFESEDADPSSYFALIDEAHNLVDRGRDCHSAFLSVPALFGSAKAYKEAGFSKTAKALSKAAILLKEAPEGDATPDWTGVFSKLLSSFEEKARAEEKAKRESPPKEVSETGREIHRFLVLSEIAGPDALLRIEESPVKRLALYCRDPSSYLWGSLSALKGATLFSGTLSPSSYFLRQLVGKTDYPILKLPSPFDSRRMKLLLSPVSVRYRDRERTLPFVASMLESFVKGKRGNYFLFFPSFEYLEKVQPLLHLNGAETYVQSPKMKDGEKEEFLSKFVPEAGKTKVGLLVVGGSFSEGVDLVSDRLIGVAVVGSGLPGIGPERDAVREYFDRNGDDGYYLSYLAPGLNRVMQGVGRLIRSETDTGAALLIDDRYRGGIRDVLEERFGGAEVVTSPKDLEKSLSSFYEGLLRLS